jgi:hypothetical protein
MTPKQEYCHDHQFLHMLCVEIAMPNGCDRCVHHTHDGIHYSTVYLHAAAVIRGGSPFLPVPGHGTKFAAFTHSNLEWAQARSVYQSQITVIDAGGSSMSIYWYRHYALCHSWCYSRFLVCSECSVSPAPELHSCPVSFDPISTSLLCSYVAHRWCDVSYLSGRRPDVTDAAEAHGCCIPSLLQHGQQLSHHSTVSVLCYVVGY